MFDRFKFRIWHKPLKQMHYNDFIVTATGYMAKIYQQDDYMMKFNQEDLEFDKQCILMQCTGLKDKNDNLIYEGDILRDDSRVDKPLYIVNWIDCSTGFGIKMISPRKYELYSEWHLNRSKYDYVVVGNIYENVELIESEK